jgi:ribonuclease P/MRP protein subunit POP3
LPCAGILDNDLTTYASSLLEPIGRHRSAFVVPSKGKRAKKRKRDEENAAKANASELTSASQAHTLPNQPPPEVSKHITVGFNSIVRCLDPAARRMIDGSSASDNISGPDSEPLNLTAIFVDRSSCAEILWSQLPYLAIAAGARSALPPARLVPLPRGAAARLSSAVGIQRATIIGFGRDVPDAQALTQYVAEHVASIEIPWMTGLSASIFKPTEVGLHQSPRERERGNG